MQSRFSTEKPEQYKHLQFHSYSNSELDSYGSAIFKLWQESGETDDQLKRSIIMVGEEKTFRGMW